MKQFFEDFKEFIAQGNIIDMAVGVIIGGAFGKIVASLVDDVIMPLLGLLLGGINFSNLFVSLDGTKYTSITQAQEAGAAIITYGKFIQNIIDFLIIALVIFLVLRQITKLHKHFVEEVEEAKTTKICPYCKTEIPLEATRCPHCTSILDE